MFFYYKKKKKNTVSWRTGPIEGDAPTVYMIFKDKVLHGPFHAAKLVWHYKQVFQRENFCKYKGMYVMTHNFEGHIKNLVLAGIYTKVDDFCRYIQI